MKIICVVGPTGVGKTLLSETLAEHLNGIIINADSMQVYKELNIGTAKVTEEEKKSVDHYLFDIKNPSEDYSVYDYQRDIRKIIEENKDKNIIIVGGTGLYIKAALYNYEFTEHDTNSYDEYSNEELYEMVQKRFNDEKVHINNRKRLISKLNSSPNNFLKDELLYSDVYIVGLTTDRSLLYEKINNRVDKMIDDGLICEVKSVYSKYGKTKALNTGIGYKELIDYFDGLCSKEDAIEKIKQNSRHYAKRQYTWFNNQMDVKWFNTDYNNFDNTINEVLSYVESK